MIFWKKKKGAEYTGVKVDHSSPVYKDLPWGNFPEHGTSHSFNYYDDILLPSGSLYGVEVYEFCGSGTNQYPKVFTEPERFCHCEYCGSKNKTSNEECRKCGAPL